MRKMLSAFLFLLTLLSVSLSSVYAEDVDVTLSYRMEGITTHELKVTVNGPGMLKDGEAEIRDGTNIYELRADAEKIFHICPDEGSYLVSILIDGQELTDTTEELVIKELKEDSEVVVTFAKDEESKDPNTNEENNGSDQNDPNGEGSHGNGNANSDLPDWNKQTPPTGVVKRTGVFALLASLSAGILCYLKYREHDETDE